MTEQNWPLWEVFIRTRNGMAHRHAGSVHAVDAAMALQNARDVYTRRGEGLSIWVVPSAAITASDPAEQRASGEATVYATSLVVRAATPETRAHVPYNIVLVDTVEGFRMMAHGDNDLSIGDKVIARFEQFAGRLVPYFARTKS